MTEGEEEHHWPCSLGNVPSTLELTTVSLHSSTTGGGGWETLGGCKRVVLWVNHKITFLHILVRQNLIKQQWNDLQFKRFYFEWYSF